MPSSESSPVYLLNLHGVGVCYPGSVQALRHVCLGFQPGRCVALLGPSGSGKSSLLRSVNHLVVPTQGHIELEGLGVLTRRNLRRHRLQTGMIFQQHQLNPRQTVLQNVLNGRLGRHPWYRTLFPASRAEQTLALRCIERVGLLDKALVRADQLSGGQQQRVGIARALAQEPRIILADEPVASLDPAAANAFLEQLREICREDGILALMSLHQVDLARRFADRIVGLRQGVVVFDGPPEELSEERVHELYSAPCVQPSPTPHTQPLHVLTPLGETP